jgi:hypothetical protein
VPHGINANHYFPIETGGKDYEEYQNFKQAFLSQHPSDFIVFWVNRNARRKQPGDVILAFKEFTRMVLKSHPDKRVTLLMHTQPRDENGTDLIAVQEAIAPECNIIFTDGQRLSVKQMNFYYNLVDVTVNIASNEGFGLSSAESIMSGTVVINNVTGGLQDQCRFVNESGQWIKFDSEFTSNHTGKYTQHGSWVKPVFPAVRSLQGSIPTPYIFDDRCKFEDVAVRMYEWFLVPAKDRDEAGMEGRRWLMSDESGMSAKSMCSKFVNNLNFIIQNWKPAERFTFEKIQDSKAFKQAPVGITPDYLALKTDI